MNRWVSFTYHGRAFDTPDGFSGFVGASDGSGTVKARNVTIVVGPEKEHRSYWLEFSPDEAIGLAESIIDAAEHAKGGAKDGGVRASCSCSKDTFADIPTPVGATEIDYWHEDGHCRRSFSTYEWFLVTESSKHCPSCGEVGVSIVGVQEDSGHIDAHICLDSDSQMNSSQARELAAVLMDAADALDGLGGCK